MKFTRTRVSAPSPVLTMDEARAQLRVDTYGSPPTNPEDSLIAAAAEAATQELDAGTGWLGRALNPQTWRLGLQTFPAGKCSIALPFPPFIEIVSVSYTDTLGNQVTMTDGTDYRVIMRDDIGHVAPIYGGFWPTDAREDFDSIQIVFRCGYAEGSPETPAVPALIKNWIKARMTDIFDTRGTHDNAAIQRNEIIDAGGYSLNSVRVWDYEP